jgi:hypothetical protein
MFRVTAADAIEIFVSCFSKPRLAIAIVGGESDLTSIQAWTPDAV